MAFVVEDGTSLPGANAYCSVPYVTAYASDRSIASFGLASLAAQQAAIVATSDYLDARYNWWGSKTAYMQGLGWPRTGAYDRAAMLAVPPGLVPPLIMRAVAELAIKVIGGVILLQDMRRGGRIITDTVGPLSQTFEAGSDVGTTYGITGLLRGLISDIAGIPPSPWSGTTGTAGYFSDGQFNNPGVIGEEGSGSFTADGSLLGNG